MTSASTTATPLCFLVGPTASGKSELALAVAERAGAEIISLDSMLVYRGMDIGTAKPDAAARARVRHHALDLVQPSEPFTIQDYLRAAEAALADVSSRGARALFVGGTALYAKALIHGLFHGPEVDPALRAELEARYEREGAANVHAELARLDARSATRIHANDKKRVVRALEVWHQTGRTLSDWQREWGWHERNATVRPHAMVGVSWPTDELDLRVRARTRAMLDQGWAAEARAIHEGQGFGPTAIQALGYSTALELALEHIDRDQAERAIALATRQFARRQRTWLRKFERLVWLRADKAADPAERVGEVRGVLGW
jgi:tRNA dimethylallyltransferase